MLKSPTITPVKLLLIDGLGALLSTVLLGVVLVSLQEHIGLPVNTLYWLAGVAFLFCIYSLSAYFSKPAKDWIYLRLIAIVNICYCIVTLALVFYHLDAITMLGISYFLAEIIIVVGLSIFELKVSSMNR